MPKTPEKEEDDTSSADTGKEEEADDTDKKTSPKPQKSESKKDVIPEEAGEARRWAAQQALQHQTRPFHRYEEIVKELQPDTGGYRTGGFPVEEGGPEPAPGDPPPAAGELMPPVPLLDVANITAEGAQGMLPPRGGTVQSTLRPITAEEEAVERDIFGEAPPEPLPGQSRIMEPPEEGF